MHIPHLIAELKAELALAAGEDAADEVEDFDAAEAEMMKQDTLVSA